ncbi:uncharacterized protein LOC135166489 [Diachasmimorpha longicaudata]|uniref:uncharacterized protein LOC135166489 n=1 Tax=Diachasmimorpha longicaudata TaxID=58733 RepID=UPI0030B8BEE9
MDSICDLTRLQELNEKTFDSEKKLSELDSVILLDTTVSSTTVDSTDLSDLSRTFDHDRQHLKCCALKYSQCSCDLSMRSEMKQENDKQSSNQDLTSKDQAGASSGFSYHAQSTRDNLQIALSIGRTNDESPIARLDIAFQKSTTTLKSHYKSETLTSSVSSSRTTVSTTTTSPVTSRAWNSFLKRKSSGEFFDPLDEAKRRRVKRRSTSFPDLVAQLGSPGNNLAVLAGQVKRRLRSCETEDVQYIDLDLDIPSESVKSVKISRDYPKHLKKNEGGVMKMKKIGENLTHPTKSFQPSPGIPGKPGKSKKRQSVARELQRPGFVVDFRRSPAALAKTPKGKVPARSPALRQARASRNVNRISTVTRSSSNTAATHATVAKKCRRVPGVKTPISPEILSAVRSPAGIRGPSSAQNLSVRPATPHPQITTCVRRKKFKDNLGQPGGKTSPYFLSPELLGKPSVLFKRGKYFETPEKSAGNKKLTSPFDAKFKKTRVKYANVTSPVGEYIATGKLKTRNVKLVEISEMQKN